jgi:isopentenyl-diphosphate delta-isomerase
MDIEAAERVVLVDADDREIGTEAKLPAHRAGVLHRAFSILVFNARGETMLQQRAPGKYHSGGLWTNVCCGHPRPGEAVESAAHRRLREEMGFDCPLSHAFSFTYRVDLDRGLTEHEYDHVFVGRFDGEPVANPAEASGWRWAAPEALDREIAAAPERFTEWFKIAWAELRRRERRPSAS